MTGPEDSYSNTRPISVAELLAKNGTIGAPPVGGRRRRRRGNSDSVTVAELTGEIPIVSGHDVDENETTRTLPAVKDEPVSTNGVDSHVDEVELEEPEAEAEPAQDEYDDDAADDYADAVAEYSTHIERRDTDEDLVDFFAPPPRRPQYAPGQRRFGVVGAEQMSPDPVDEDEEDLVLTDEPEIEDEDTEAALAEEVDAKDELPSYLRATSGTLFGGQTVADDLARGSRPRPEDIDLEDDADLEGGEAASSSGMSSVLRTAWVVGQCIIAVAFGAGLFIAFDQLWKWNNIVALVLSVLVILGLVVGVRVVRKTEDIGSTLIAVAVGALVTLGPLALLQSG
ncbi:hypothetical protein GGC64_005321 [Mycobacterium sp. OAS707]|uniref:hypothetical protein n=1 Tax=Mycobacterium sp. OAS707 TaxID=2663822 RepID=UPI00178A243D|nr:hypothetical protein [Mycobacterium sp. OAS707]MBE1551261.1 hypothetical protein [Mycobacterium sp. OAS707]